MPSSSLETPAPADPLRLRAMELRGGNDAASERFTLDGFEAFLYSRPHKGDARGGDLRFISTCAMGNIARFTLADLAGHGEEAGELALRLKGLLRKHINTPNPTKLAQTINREFARLAEAGRFATALITTYFAPTDHLIICNAGHPRPLLYRGPRPGDAGGWELFDQSSSCATRAENARQTGISNLPLGIIGKTDYPQFATRLEPGDVVVTYTDALIESADAHGNQLGEQGLLGIVRALDGLEEPERLGRRILQAVAAFRGGKEADDDESLMVLCHTGTNPPDGAWPRLMALGRVVGLLK
jgi:sigma-B regulation protein RsbU (phosphoserine phosphatase)